MATIPVAHPELAHHEWESHFTGAERERQLLDDLSAGKSVALVLVSVVAMGAAIMAATVLFTV